MIYQRDGERLIVIASAGGATHPSWWLNLSSTPKATVELGRETMAIIASEAADAERDRLWALMLAAYPAYANYAARTSRRMPVVVPRPA